MVPATALIILPIRVPTTAATRIPDQYVAMECEAPLTYSYLLLNNSATF